MRNIFLVSDTHFSHQNILKFTGSDNLPIRVGFMSADEMDEFMIHQWNSVVKSGDIVYHLGDVGFNRNKLDVILPKLNGKKRLILGNHDSFKMSYYELFFQKIMVTRQFGSVILSHYPIIIDDGHPRLKWNFHGHIHGNRNQVAEMSKQHINLNVERWNYLPQNIEDIVANNNIEGFKT